MWFIVFCVVGFLCGLIARALVSGPSPSGCLPTTLLGIAGSFVGGFLGYVLFGKDLQSGAIQPSGWIGSIIGAVGTLAGGLLGWGSPDRSAGRTARCLFPGPRRRPGPGRGT